MCVPNFGKSPLWVCLKLLEFLSLPQSADITETHFKYFYTFPCNSMHFYCIGTINEQKTKFSSCFSELNIQCAKCSHKGDFQKFGHI